MAYKVFANGFPLTASELNTYLMNQSVMVFTDSTARSAALTSPTEGMITYLENNNKAQYYDGAAWQDLTVDASAFIAKSVVTTTGDLIVANGNASVTRLGIGTNGQVLQSNGTTATWVSPTSGSMTLLASGNLSTSSSQLQLNSISQSYKSLNLRISNFQQSSGNTSLYAEFNGSTGSNYRSIYVRYNISSVQAYTTTAFYIGEHAGNNPSYLDLWFPNYTVSAKPKIIEAFYGTDTAGNNTAHWANFNENGAITSIRFYNSASYNWSSGSYELYGVN